jgi:predicted PurR-regulated permease PerM
LIQRKRDDQLWESQDFRALVFLGVLGALTAIFAFAIRGILGPFLMAGVLALILNPLVNLVERYRVPRVLAILGIYAVGLILLAAGIAFIVPLARQESIALVKQGPAIAAYFQDLAAQHHAVSIFGIPLDLRQTYSTLAANMPALLAGHVQSLVANLFSLLNWIVQALLMLVIAFFLVKDAHAIRRFFEQLVPKGYRTDVRGVAQDIYRMLGAYMRGELLICGLVGVVTAIAMLLVGVPYWLALGVVAGVTAFIPFVGPLLGALPAVAVAAFVSQSPSKVVLVLIIYFIISNIIYNFISPKVFGDAVHLSPMLIIFAFVVGGYAAGILGLFLAVPVAASIRIVFLYLHERVYA